MNSSTLDKFYYWEKTAPARVFLRQPINGKWIDFTFAEAAKEIRSITAALRNMKLPKGSCVAILSKNCAHWIMADLAIAMAGYVSVPIYPSLSDTGIKYVLDHSESKVIFLGKLDNYKNQTSGIAPDIIKISFPVYGPSEGLLWEDLIHTKAIEDSYQPQPEDIATIIYSSGTTGTPKGVMLSFGAMDFFGTAALKSFGVDSPSSFFSYLPLAHIAERAYIEIVAIYSGSKIAFAESLDTFASNLSDVQPILFGGVPRIYAKFQEGILSKLSQQKIDFIISIPFVGSVFKKFIRKKLGLSNTKIVGCGAAPIPIALLQWYKNLGINIQELYGMTENCGYSHGDNGGESHFGTVGKAWKDVDVRLSNEGEILVRHGGLMNGYFKDPIATSAAFTEDGFLKTGDKGFIDADGFLTLTGRLKDHFKTDKGKFIAPAAIEMKLLASDEVEQVCVVGSGVPQPIALINLSSNGKKKSKSELLETLSGLMSEVNKTLESYEQLTKIVVMKDDWSIDNGLLTPTLKVKRNEVEKIYLPMYPLWYRESKAVVWQL